MAGGCGSIFDRVVNDRFIQRSKVFHFYLQFEKFIEQKIEKRNFK